MTLSSIVSLPFTPIGEVCEQKIQHADCLICLVCILKAFPLALYRGDIANKFASLTGYVIKYYDRIPKRNDIKTSRAMNQGQ